MQSQKRRSPKRKVDWRMASMAAGKREMDRMDQANSGLSKPSKVGSKIATYKEENITQAFRVNNFFKLICFVFRLLLYSLK
jgi:hypothetical protein